MESGVRWWKYLMLHGELGWAVQLLGFSPGLRLLGFISLSSAGASLGTAELGQLGLSCLCEPSGKSRERRTRSVADVVFYEEGRYTSLIAWATCYALLI